MIQNAIGDMTEYAHVKQLADLGVANGSMPLIYDSYLTLLLEACATFDTRRELPGSVLFMQLQFQAMIQNIDDAGYEAYLVDTMIPEIMVNAADSNRFSGMSGNHSQGSGQIPYSECGLR
jgi:hypothetical protein